MGRIPRRFLTDTVTVEPYLGQDAHGAVYGPPVEVRGNLQEERKNTSGGSGHEIISSSAFYCDLDAPIGPEARLTLPSGEQTRAVDVYRRDGKTLPVPSHLEVRIR